MSAPSQDNNAFHAEFQSVSSGTGHHISGNFRLDIPLAAVAFAARSSLQLFCLLSVVLRRLGLYTSKSLEFVSDGATWIAKGLREMIVNYEERKEAGWRVASTQVEKWNDICVSQRCKGREMSWTLGGVMTIALYAGKIKHTTSRMIGKYSTSKIHKRN